MRTKIVRLGFLLGLSLTISGCLGLILRHGDVEKASWCFLALSLGLFLSIIFKILAWVVRTHER